MIRSLPFKAYFKTYIVKREKILVRLFVFVVIMEESLKTQTAQNYLKGISHGFSSPITPQQNGIVERKNHTLQEMARVMLHSKNPSYHF